MIKNPKKRMIKVFERDGEEEKLIYQGEDKRTYDKDYHSAITIFGVPIIEAVKLISYLIMLIVFLVRTDVRIGKIEETQQLLSNTVERFGIYAQNSDGWHSSVLGTAFKDGKPINDNIDVKQLKRNFVRDGEN